MRGHRVVGQERAEERVACQRRQVATVEVAARRCGAVVVGDIAAELGGIVRVDRRAQAEREHPIDGMLVHRGNIAQFDVGERADGERHA